MAQIFREDGLAVPVTVVRAGPCTITQIRTMDKDGYEAAQLGFGEANRLNRPERGHLRRAGVFSRHLKEFAVDDNRTPAGRPAAYRRDVPAGATSRRGGHLQGQGLPGCHEAPRFPWWPPDPWPIGQGASPRLHRRRNNPWQGVQGQEDGRPHGQCACHGQELRNRGRRPSAEPDHDKGGPAGLYQWVSHDQAKRPGRGG